ncbi:transcriptional regulator of acetoin/glycerol metabolism [Azospirillum lipoferum]|uniref:Sigma-54-dependent Fis family transcriptional regulator n=1 Tax=Azospirillum lipoferum TaxID=193 RepID=A0A5A9GRG7_AZOLI|nr:MULTISPECIES: sigma-54-dependent Fis family transcriptional regulator [Azospirillum]KAA0596395.1 sigma-54-dependent Fis family transcriptional regulator [Azospirillum lipoferum]MCP1610378.1 transcriptional regulator of acetoin/glycerol metabolism [Azospirillum lipoferum]MDW5538178.1 sigma-54-dependent Fis family transcriptional regulator [Azospirillum sp. NL1]
MLANERAGIGRLAVASSNLTLHAPGDGETVTMKAWEDFVSGSRRDNLPVRDVVIRSWARCQSFLVDARADAAPVVGSDHIEALRRDNRDLLQAAAATLAEAADLLAGTRTVMLITDANGVVLDAAGDRATLTSARDISLACGGQWGETCAGTNGIGTALASRQPVLVQAAEHYCAGIKGWSCAGAPIHDPVDGSIVGLLDISGLKQSFSGQALALAVVAARQVEWNLARQTEAEHVRLLEACLEDSQKYAGEGLIALDARGRLLYASRKAAHLLKASFGSDLPQLSRGTRLPIPGIGVGGGAGEGTGCRLPVPSDWVRPLMLDGERRGTLLVIPAAASARSSVGRRAVPDESDHARSRFADIVGASDSLRMVIGQGERLAPLPVPILIEGETGVGKELFARAVHGHSAVAGGPFVPFNCGAVSREMLGSELFGYVRGAFTGAAAEGRIGRFELADGGTLCLDEIGELPLDLQPYLLRVLEEGVLYRIGDNVPRRVSVRLLAMTNRNLRQEVAAGRFRRDLYHRLAVTALRVPPLRERHGDVPRLISHFNAQLAERHGRAPVRFTAAALDLLQRYDWPGNVRELRNAVERAVLLSTSGSIDVDDLPDELRDACACGMGEGWPLLGSPVPPVLASTPITSVPLAAPTAVPAAMALTVTEQRTIEEVIAATGGNLSDAAAVLGISRSTLYRKLSQHGIQRTTARKMQTGRAGIGFGQT